MKATVVGAGLAGCEAAWALARRGVDVTLIEMKPKKFSPAHRNAGFAELVCSNSLKAMRIESASGLLKEEMRAMGSLLIRCAEQCAVPAGGALAVDRDRFSALVTARIEGEEKIRVERRELCEIPSEGAAIIATGPLTSEALAASIAQRTKSEHLSFYDAAAPIITFESVDMTRAFFAARYGRGDEDYINCAMDKAQYAEFWQQLVSAEAVIKKEFEPTAVFEGCMPIEVLAARGEDAIRYGPMRPVGLIDPATGKRPWAVVQLRAENSAKTLYNMVGFQTNLKFKEQERIFRMIPGLEKAEFVRFGVMHRNTFLDAPRLLDNFLCLKSAPQIRFAGQITGVEGYMESAATGIAAGINLARKLKGLPQIVWPATTMTGALLAHTANTAAKNYQPMGSNMGLLPPLEKKVRGKSERYLLMAERALADLAQMSSCIGEETL
jgi:methylenetetrahydrofolate--tRNA-(uracil-5-)-methyltransferase